MKQNAILSVIYSVFKLGVLVVNLTLDLLKIS